MSNIRLKDIAEKLGVSTVTVSNALSGKYGVSDELRAEIERTAKDMGYKKYSEGNIKTAGGGSDGIHGKKIAVVTCETYMEKYTSFYWELYQRTAFDASKLGCIAMLEMFSAEMERKGTVPELVNENRADGVIILGKTSTEYIRRIVNAGKAPVILLDFTDENSDCSAVISNGFYGMYAMTNYLFNAGHRNIAFVGNIRATGSIMDRYMGYSKSFMEHGIKERADWIISDRNPQTGKNTVIELPDEMPTAFVCNCDYTAAILAAELRLEGYRVPEDISIVSYDDYLAEGKDINFFTTYAVDMDAMASNAVKLLTKLISGGNLKKTVIVVDGKPVIRNSVKHI